MSDNKAKVHLDEHIKYLADTKHGPLGVAELSLNRAAAEFRKGNYSKMLDYIEDYCRLKDAALRSCEIFREEFKNECRERIKAEIDEHIETMFIPNLAWIDEYIREGELW